MKNYDGWKNFISSGRVDDYLNYIACTSEEYIDHMQDINVEKEGGYNASVNSGDGNGSISHASW